MPGPGTETEALAWIMEAMEAGRYIAHPHFDKRCRERQFTVFDAKRIVATATVCTAYVAARTFAGGTSWRLTGIDTDDREAQIGVEAFVDHLGRRVLLLTIMG